MLFQLWVCFKFKHDKEKPYWIFWKRNQMEFLLVSQMCAMKELINSWIGKDARVPGRPQTEEGSDGTHTRSLWHVICRWSKASCDCGSVPSYVVNVCGLLCMMGNKHFSVLQSLFRHLSEGAKHFFFTPFVLVARRLVDLFSCTTSNLLFSCSVNHIVLFLFLQYYYLLYTPDISFILKLLHKGSTFDCVIHSVWL